jgi:hypothetical protein
MNINEESQISIPLRNVFGIVSAILSAAWGYFELTEQVNSVEKDVAVIQDDMVENSKYIERLSELEKRILIIETKGNSDG